MGLTSAYLTSTKNLEGILAALQNAQAPPRFTTRFLASLGYKSPADRLIIGVLKGLGFLDEAGVPLDRYFKYLDKGEAKRILAGAIREAYGDLFAINVNAGQLAQAEVRNKLKTLTHGQKSDNVVRLMALTFTSLCALADWSQPESQLESPDVQPESSGLEISSGDSPKDMASIIGSLCYRIEIVLPATRDTAVYDALFKSLKEHLLR